MATTCPVCQLPIQEGATTCPNCNFRLSGATQEFMPVKPAPVKEEAPVEGHAVLRMVRGPQVGVMYPIDKQVVTIGRNPNSDIFLNDMTVSREHAEISRLADAFVITDLHSYNGVWINNKTIDQHALRPGDYVQIGKYDFVYEENPAEQRS